MKKKNTVRKKMTPPDELSSAAILAAARGLLANPDYIVINKVLQQMEVDILERGKKKPSEALWSELRGFHNAAMLPELIVARGARDSEQSQADELQETL
jgi:hypothetical protein